MKNPRQPKNCRGYLLNGNKISGFGEPETITLPYTAKTSGILQIYVAAASAGNANYYIKINNRITRLQIKDGGVASASFPVCKGETIVLEVQSNVKPATLNFIPFKYSISMFQ